MICKFEFEQDGRGRWVLRRGSRQNASGIYQFWLGEWFGGEPFAYFVNILRYRVMKDARMQGMQGIISCHSMRSLGHMASGKIYQTASLSLYS